MRRWLNALAGLTLLASPTLARANMAAIQYNPAKVFGPEAAGPTDLVIEEEHLTFRCFDAERAPACDFEARYHVHNPKGERREAAVSFYGVGTDGVSVTIDGAPASGEPTQDEQRALDDAMKRADAASATKTGGNKAEKLDRRGFRLVVAPGARREVVVTGRVHAGLAFVPEGYAMAAVNSRHLLVSREAPDHLRYDLEYLVSPIHTWQGDPSIHVRVEHPRDLRIDVGGQGSPGFRREVAGGRVALSATLRARDLSRLTLHVDKPGPLFRNGGLLLGIGGTVGPEKRARGRVGYEVAAPSWLLYSANFETDFKHRFIVAPVVEAASPAILILPSLGVGVGVPVQIAPDPRPGFRVQLDAMIYAVGFGAAIDTYPKLGKLSGFTEASLMGQVGF